MALKRFIRKASFSLEEGLLLTPTMDGNIVVVVVAIVDKEEF